LKDILLNIFKTFLGYVPNHYGAVRFVRFVIRDSSKLAIFYSCKICKQSKWTYSSNLHLSFNIRVNSLAERFFKWNQRTWITTNHA